MSERASFDTGRVRLKARLRTFFAAAASLSGLAWAWRVAVARRGVRVLAYHGVEPVPSSPFSVSVEEFEKQVAHLARTCEVIDMETFLAWRDGAFVSDRPLVMLTFDDGFRNNLTHAAPILRRHGLPATFFVIGSKLDGTDERFMTAAEVAELAACDLFDIGSHSTSHRSIGRISAPERREEIDGSKSLLESALAREVACFCYPYGTYNDFDRDSGRALASSGYRLGFTSVNGVNFRTTDPCRLRRTKVEWSDDMTTFARLLGGALDGWVLVDFFLRFLQRPRAVSFDRERRAETGAA